MKNRGFTLLETIIVLAIMTMFFAVSVPLFSKFTERTKLDTTARSIVSALRLARTYAITNNENYYVKFDKIVTPNEYYVYYYKQPGNVMTIVDKEYKLPVGISFGALTDFTGSQVVFKPTGEVEVEGTIPVTDGTDTKLINVEKTTGRARIE
ncbi:MAG: GspH/FimT family pseudopilin [Candidatus Omnitrophica bacterium]|nr:GspH/FimT family pseudopilin [Candidatus Omnitrophota bacterium]MBU4488433.1 GspH/FimT family pseudopilin [Candidatus Omnitrophota bacterium]MCG2705146.1 GspH/FimT family pseudopilin [Candidatus Omnitrophota bacterium]